MTKDLKNIIIFGATGAVGKEIIKLLNQNFIFYNRIKLLASESSAGKRQIINEKTYIIEAVQKDSFKNFDFAIFCVDSILSEYYAPYAIEDGCKVIDNSAHFRMNYDVPLIVPEVNISTFKNQNIIANPNCCTILLTTALKPIYENNRIKEISVSTYQSASGAGINGIDELIQQTKIFGLHINENNNLHLDNISYPTKVFGRRYLWNVFSHNSEIDLENGYNNEELKIIEETKKILNDEEMEINATCVRVPVLRSHCESISIVLEKPTTVQKIKEYLMDAPGIAVLDNREDNLFPEPRISSYKHFVYVGRIRQRLGDKTGCKFELFLSGDQLLKGAALNALQIAKKIF